MRSSTPIIRCAAKQRSLLLHARKCSHTSASYRLQKTSMSAAVSNDCANENANSQRTKSILQTTRKHSQMMSVCLWQNRYRAVMNFLAVKKRRMKTRSENSPIVGKNIQRELCDLRMNAENVPVCAARSMHVAIRRRQKERSSRLPSALCARTGLPS